GVCADCGAGGGQVLVGAVEGGAGDVDHVVERGVPHGGRVPGEGGVQAVVTGVGGGDTTGLVEFPPAVQGHRPVGQLPCLGGAAAERDVGDEAVVEADVVDAAGPVVVLDALVLAAAHGHRSTGRPGALVHGTALLLTIDVEGDLAGGRVIGAHQVGPHPGLGGLGGQRVAPAGGVGGGWGVLG